MKTTPEKVLFNYLKDIIFEDNAGPAESSELPEDWKESLKSLEDAVKRQRAENREALEKARTEAAQTRELFKRVTDNTGRYIALVLSEKNEELYQNKKLVSMRKINPLLVRKLEERILAELKDKGGALENWETEIVSQDPESGLPIRWNFIIDVNGLSWDGEPATVYVIEDVTQERRKEKELAGQGFHDSLTGLHNRHYIMSLLDDWLREEEQFCLAFVDLDNMKGANEAFGPAEGDRYIKQAAGLLSEIEGEKELARTGGDEFMLLVKNCRGKVLERKLEEKRYHLLHRGMVSSADYRKSFSYGIIDSDKFGSRNKSLMLREADALMHDYKTNNKAKIRDAGQNDGE